MAASFQLLRPEDRLTRLQTLRLCVGLTQKEMAWATGLAIASYKRLEWGELANPPIGWLTNCALVLGADGSPCEVDLDDLIEDNMYAWHTFQQSKPPPPSWCERDEMRERAESWRLYHKKGDSG